MGSVDGSRDAAGLWRVKMLAVWIGDEFARDVGVLTGSLIILLNHLVLLMRDASR